MHDACKQSHNTPLLDAPCLAAVLRTVNMERLAFSKKLRHCCKVSPGLLYGTDSPAMQVACMLLSWRAVWRSLYEASGGSRLPAYCVARLCAAQVRTLCVKVRHAI